jgi:diguanylate cyclase (GGDEF)-like protein
MAKAGATLIMMDIDNFKSVNDNYGHKEGDRVLIGLADMLKKTVAELAPDASVGRWGGEEFMVLLQGVPIESAIDFANKVCRAFNELSFEKAGNRSMSVGVTEIRAGESSDEACVRVDQALYKAKDEGKNRVVVL